MRDFHIVTLCWYSCFTNTYNNGKLAACWLHNTRFLWLFINLFFFCNFFVNCIFTIWVYRNMLHTIKDFLKISLKIATVTSVQKIILFKWNKIKSMTFSVIYEQHLQRIKKLINPTSLKTLLVSIFPRRHKVIQFQFSYATPLQIQTIM